MPLTLEEFVPLASLAVIAWTAFITVATIEGRDDRWP